MKSPKGWKLRFDFRIYLNNDEWILLEYQGAQHRYDSFERFGEYERTVTDALKKEYCELNNIKLFEIWFDENINDKLMEI